LTAIAAVVKNNVFLDKFQYKLYPNVYTLLVGKSGLRKGPPVNLARALVTAVDTTRVIAGRTSIQAVIADLARSVTKDNGKAPITDASGMLVSSEFASFLIADPQALTILTDLYDGHYNPEWINRTKVSGQEVLKNPCITMLGASNEIHIKDAIPSTAMGGGFFARTFIIFADKKANVNALVDRPTGLLPWDGLVQQLREISKAKGPFKWSEDGKARYKSWYESYQGDEDLDDTTGTMERLHDHILKVAMLISLARNPLDMMLSLPDIEEAIKACMDYIPGAKRVALGQIGTSVSAPGTAVLLRELLTNAEHRIRRDHALHKYWHHFDAPELDRIADSLVAQKAIRIVTGRDDDGGLEIWYYLNPKVLERYLERQVKEE
jgi:hypothetical protein